MHKVLKLKKYVYQQSIPQHHENKFIEQKYK